MLPLKRNMAFTQSHTPPFVTYTATLHYRDEASNRSLLAVPTKQYRNFAYFGEADKTTAINDALEHFRVVRMERAYYKSVCEECRERMHAHFVTNGEFTLPAPGCKIPCNTNRHHIPACSWHALLTSTHIHVHTRACTHTHKTHIHEHTCTHTHTHTHKTQHMHAHTHMHTHTHTAHPHTCTHMYTHTCMQTHNTPTMRTCKHKHTR